MWHDIHYPSISEVQVQDIVFNSTGEMATLLQKTVAILHTVFSNVQ